MNKIIDNTEDGIHIYEYDIAYYFNDNGEKQYVFATSSDIRTMTLDDSLGNILVNGKKVEGKKLYLSTFSLYKRLIAAGFLTPISLRMNNSSWESAVWKLLKRAFDTFEAIFTNCPLSVGYVDDEFVFINKNSGQEVFSADIYNFLADLLEEVSSATFPNELDWFLVKYYYRVKEGK